MKKLLALLLVLAMVFSMMAFLTACGDDEDTDEDKSDKKDDDEDEDDKKDDEDEDEDKKDDEDEDDKKDDEDEDDKKDDEDKDDEKDDPEPTEPEDEDDGLVGEWVATIDMADLMNMMFEEMDMLDYLAIDDPFEVEMTIVFEDNGEYTISFDEKDFEKAIKNVIPDWTDGFADLIQDQGMTVEEFEAEVGMSLEEYIEEEMAGSMSAAEFETYGDYTLEGNHLYMDEEDEYYKIDLNGDEFEFLSYTGNDEGMLDMIFGGVVFERQ